MSREIVKFFFFLPQRQLDSLTQVIIPLCIHKNQIYEFKISFKNFTKFFLSCFFLPARSGWLSESPLVSLAVTWLLFAMLEVSGSGSVDLLLDLACCHLSALRSLGLAARFWFPGFPSQ